MNAVLDTIRDLSRPAEAANELHELSMELAYHETIPLEIQERVRELTSAVAEAVDLPVIGHAAFAIDVANGRPASLATLVIGFAPAAIAIAPFRLSGTLACPDRLNPHAATVPSPCKANE